MRLPQIPRRSSSPLRPFAAAIVLGSLCSLVLRPAPASAQVAFTQEKDAVHVTIDGQPFTDFVLQGGNAMKPYLYPLRTATGKLVTRHFPMETVEGEPKDHPHQRGLWFAHERVNGTDFWNNEADYKTTIRGRIVVTKISDVQGGGDSGNFTDSGSFHADLDWVDQNGVKLISEARKMTFRKTPALRIIDLDVKLVAAVDVTFGDAKDGAFGIRLAAALEEPASKPVEGQIAGTGTITNAEGLEHEKAVWGKYSNWVDYSGEVDGEKVGVAVFEDSANSRRSRWHVRGYGLLAANPFGQKAFTKDASQDGSVPLKTGESLDFRYRVIIHPGDAKAANVAALWDDFLKEAK